MPPFRPLSGSRPARRTGEVRCLGRILRWKGRFGRVRTQDVVGGWSGRKGDETRVLHPIRKPTGQLWPNLAGRTSAKPQLREASRARRSAPGIRKKGRWKDT
eukprot:scaffold131_cov335-Pavlova_lutheri.AAC.6